MLKNILIKLVLLFDGRGECIWWKVGYKIISNDW